MKNLHRDSNGNVVRLANLDTSNNLAVHNPVFPHLYSNYYDRTPPDVKTHKLIDHILIDMRWNTSVLDAQSLKGSYCDTDHYPQKLGKYYQ